MAPQCCGWEPQCGQGGEMELLWWWNPRYGSWWGGCPTKKGFCETSGWGGEGKEEKRRGKTPSTLAMSYVAGWGGQNTEWLFQMLSDFSPSNNFHLLLRCHSARHWEPGLERLFRGENCLKPSSSRACRFLPGHCTNKSDLM